jgi:hypothetical protein
MTESTASPPPYRRIGVIEATVWHNADASPPYKVTIRRIFRNNAGNWRSSPPTRAQYEEALTALSHIAASMVNEARVNDVVGEPEPDPALTIH